jgi:hypothetical protein
MKSSRDSKQRKSEPKALANSAHKRGSAGPSNRRRMLNIDPAFFALLLKVSPGASRR